MVQGHGRLSRMGDLSRGASLESLNRLSLSTPDLTKSASFFRSPSPSLSSQADMPAMFVKMTRPAYSHLDAATTASF